MITTLTRKFLAGRFVDDEELEKKTVRKVISANRTIYLVFTDLTWTSFGIDYGYYQGDSCDVIFDDYPCEELLEEILKDQEETT